MTLRLAMRVSVWMGGMVALAASTAAQSTIGTVRTDGAQIQGTVSINGGFSNVLNEKIEQQFKAGKLETDLVLFQTAQDYVRLHPKP